MAKVKGSKQEYLKVTPHRPLNILYLIMGLVISAGALVTLSFVAGRYYESGVQELDPAGKQELALIKQKTRGLESELTIDRTAIESARATINELEMEVHQQNKAIALYKGLMTPDDSGKTLRIQGFTATKGQDPQKFNITWLLAQVGGKNGSIKGSTYIRVNGSGADGEKVLFLEDVAAEVTQLPFELRYFQDFEVEITVPPEFEIHSVEILAEKEGDKGISIAQEFDWPVQGVLADAKQGQENIAP